MSSSITAFVERMKDAETAVIERSDFGAARMLTLSVRTPREHWMIRAVGPYDFRLMCGNHVPIEMCAGLHPLLAEDREPIDELELTAPIRSVPLALGALFAAHAKWVDPALMPFGTFMVPGFQALKPGLLATGPRTFINAMRIALSRCEACFKVSIVRSQPLHKKTVIRFGKTNYVRASKLACEEVALDRAIA